MSRGRNTTQRDRDRAVIRKAGMPCHICGEPIDYSLPYLDPMEFVVDHVIPLHAGGLDEIANKQPAHRRCNGSKGHRLHAPILRRSGTLARPHVTGGGTLSR